jgi:hypothetical protein
MLVNYYLLLARGGVDPEIIGSPLDSWEAVLEKAKRLIVEGVIHNADGVFWLMVHNGARPETGAYSREELEQDID